MSAPAPVTENVPLDSLARPASVGLPTSLFAHAVASGVVPIPFTVTLANEAIAVRDVLLLTTARPTCTVADMVIVSLPTRLHAAPSSDTYDVNWLPLRTIRTQCGAASSAPEV